MPAMRQGQRCSNVYRTVVSTKDNGERFVKELKGLLVSPFTDIFASLAFIHYSRVLFLYLFSCRK